MSFPGHFLSERGMMSAMEPTIALLGPPGSGKGTQAERLRDRLGFAALATGNLLREARAAGTDLGRRAAEYMDRGDLVPDEVMIAMMRDAIAGLDGERTSSTASRAPWRRPRRWPTRWRRASGR